MKQRVSNHKAIFVAKRPSAVVDVKSRHVFCKFVSISGSCLAVLAGLGWLFKARFILHWLARRSGRCPKGHGQADNDSKEADSED